MQKPPTTAPPSVRHTVRREPGSRATLEVEVDADRLARAADAVFARHVQHAKIPGFRPGKAPRAMYERTYGREHLWEEAAEDLVEDTYREILDAERIEAIDRPEVKIAELAEGKPLKYTATVVVRPEVTLGDYTKHGATVEPVAPADDEVDRTIAAMRESHAQLRPVDRPAEKGDVLTVDIDAKVGERTLSFARNAHIEAGKELGITGLGEALVGMRAGEEKKVELTFPEDTSEGELAGRTTVRNELAHAAFHEARDAAADKAMEHALATAEVEVPEVLVEDELEHLVADLKARVKEEGVPFEKFLLQTRKTEQEIRAEWRPIAVRRAKSLLVIDAIARKEGVTVSGNELAAQAAMSPLAQVDAQALRSPQVLASLARSIRNRKTVDKLIGLDSPDAEREAIRKAGGEDFDPHAAPEPKAEESKIIVPTKTDATPEGREALRAMLEKK